mmetsp:Transcript_5350/g.13827  ORF Transcript_5350/g.13827 Transcript_5350/m.13827 type:complete len:234 (+) Transcript_5350:62-763(+)
MSLLRTEVPHWRCLATEASAPAPSNAKTIQSDAVVEIAIPAASPNILAPRKTRTAPIAVSRKGRSSTACATTAYSDRRDRMANMFAVKMTAGASDDPNAAGTESIAKTMSDISMTSSTSTSGVQRYDPPFCTKNASPEYSAETGTKSCATLTTDDSARSVSSEPSSPPPPSRTILMPWKSRMAAKSSRTEWNDRTMTAPALIIAALKTTAPKIPHRSTRSCDPVGTLKYKNTM